MQTFEVNTGHYVDQPRVASSTSSQQAGLSKMLGDRLEMHQMHERMLNAQGGAARCRSAADFLRKRPQEGVQGK